MRPKKPPIITERQGKPFKVEWKRIIDRHHPLVKLSEVVDWEHLDQVFRVTYHPEVGRPACLPCNGTGRRRQACPWQTGLG